ncbi:hypothetical protein D3C72_511250 [compost metagenome]
MTWHLNGSPAPRDEGSGLLLINDIQYPNEWPRADLEALGLVWIEPALTAEDICRLIDAERDRRTALDFAHDFGVTPALDDSGAEIEAGVRLLQMRAEDQRNWQALQGAALTAVVSSAPETILPMRAEDNWNIQTPAALVLQVLAAMTAHGSALLFHGGALKSQVRAATDPASVDWMSGWPE